MTRMTLDHLDLAPLARAADYAVTYRSGTRPLHPQATAAELRVRFCTDLPEGPRDGSAVLGDLIAAAEPGLVGNTEAGFYAWVMGGSSPVGVAADWLTAAWGQNAAIYQTSPAAAIAEEAVSAWLLDLLDLPRSASVGFVTGATMAAFVGLAAARTAVLARAGHDFEALGLQNAPLIKVFLSDDAHISNHTALRHIGLGEANTVRIPSHPDGTLRLDALSPALAAHDGPKIIIGQAGHINSGAFEDFEALSALAGRHNAWLHVDGAFGLWARVLPEKSGTTRGLDRADSWSVDGHKWMQLPYDSGFAIVRDPAAHRRAMDTSAGYLNIADGDGRNPTQFGPELSRRARGFAAWAVFQTLGREGVRALVGRHCRAARRIADQISRIPGLEVLNDVTLNQVVIGAAESATIHRLSDTLNTHHGVFLRPAKWKGKDVLRISVIGQATKDADADRLAQAIRSSL